MLTYGQKICGVDFNPSSDENIAQVKQAFADIIDRMFELDLPDPRTRAVAVTQIEQAQMWTVKALTRKDFAVPP